MTDRSVLGFSLVSAACLVLACSDVSAPPSLQTAPPAHTDPDHLIETLEVVYNGTVSRASARLEHYQEIFPPADHDSLSFIFYFQPVDVGPGEEPSWGLDGELGSHRNMFRAQDARDLYSIELHIERLDPVGLQQPQPGQENWVEIFATNVNLRVMFNPQDGLLVRGGQVRFYLAPADDRWYMTEWTDLPRPAPRDDEGEPSSWGALKNLYR